jgi:hypothetical protein
VPNTSATGGYLSPANNANQLNDSAIADLLHGWIAGITGIDNTLVRPRWQQEQPNIPDINVDWCAFGITEKTNPGNPFEVHYPASVNYPDGYNELRRHQDFSALITLYGINAEKNAMVLSSGIFVAQNNEVLNGYGIFVTGHGQSTTIPELIKNKWVFRVDLTIDFRRQITLDYPVLNILSSESDIKNEYYTEIITAG